MLYIITGVQMIAPFISGSKCPFEFTDFSSPAAVTKMRYTCTCLTARHPLLRRLPTSPTY